MTINFIAIDHQRLPVAVIVLIFAIGGITTAYTYVDLLFLSTYPTEWLPYLFMGKTVFLLVFTFLVSKLVAKGSRWINAVMLMVASFTILLSRFLLDIDLNGFPFLLALWLDVVAVLAGVIAFNAVTDVFNIREMKVVGRWIYLSTGVGGLLFGLSIPWMISALGASQLLLVMAAAFTIAACGIATLSPLPASFREAQQSVKPLGYPLFVRTAAAFVLMMMMDTMADFVLKREVSLTYEGDAIGAFMGPFYGITNVVTVILQITTVNAVSKRFGMRGLLIAMPAFGIIATVGLLVAPGIWMAAAFRMGETVLRRAFDDFGRALVANPLPGQIRRVARLLWNGVSAPIGTAAAALVLWALPGSLVGVALATLAISVIWIVLNRFTLASYRTTLEEAVRVRRFGSEDDSLEDNPQLLHDLVEQSVADIDLDTRLFGYELLARYDTPFPAGAAEHLMSADSALRGAVIDAIGARRHIELYGMLLELLNRESVPANRWRILKTLALLDPKRALPLVANLLQHELAEDHAGAILILRAADEPSASNRVQQAFGKLLNSPDGEYRQSAAHVLQHMPTGEMTVELGKLLHDPEADVLMTALHAASIRNETDLIPDISRLLHDHSVGYVAAGTLATFGSIAIPALIEAAQTGGAMAVRLSLHALTRIEGAETERALSTLSKTTNIADRTMIALESAKMAARFGTGDTLQLLGRQQLDLASRELCALHVNVQEEHDEDILQEMLAREYLAKRRLLAWYAVVTEPAKVLEIMSQVLPKPSSNVVGSDRAKALELLETLTDDRELKKTVMLLETFQLTNSEAFSLELNDPWLSWFVDQLENTGDSGLQQVQIVVLLRKCNLFRDLPGEALLAIAEVSELQEVSRGDIIYSSGDYPDGLHLVVSGFINLMQDQEINLMLKKAETFGEFELLDDSPRLESAVAATDGMLLFIPQQTFEGVTEDIPEVLRRLAQSFVEYMRTSLASRKDNNDQNRTRFKMTEKETAPDREASKDATFIGNVNDIFSNLPLQGSLTTLGLDETVNVDFKSGEPIELKLASQLFRLTFSSNLPELVDPLGNVSSLKKGENMIGRDERCDIVTDSTLRDISRQHVIVEYRDDGNEIGITNLSSSGTSIASERIVA